MALNEFFHVTFINRTETEVTFKYANYEHSNQAFIHFNFDKVGRSQFDSTLGPGEQLSGTFHMHADHERNPISGSHDPDPGEASVQIENATGLQGGIALQTTVVQFEGGTFIEPYLYFPENTFSGEAKFGLYYDSSSRIPVEPRAEITAGSNLFYILSPLQ